MPLPLEPVTNLHRSQLESEAPWIWLYELETLDDPPKRFRLTNFTQSVEYGQNAAGERLRYSPAPIVHGDVIAEPRMWAARAQTATTPSSATSWG